MARDKLHEVVKRALEKDGWTITHDPYLLKFVPGQEIDLGAEKIIMADRGVDKIAVEVKSFLTASKIYKFYEALGQYISYDIGLKLQEPTRRLFLAIPEKVFKQLMSYTTVPLAFEREHVKIIVVDPIKEKIVEWKE